MTTRASRILVTTLGNGGKIPPKSQVPTQKAVINSSKKDENKSSAPTLESNRTSVIDTATPSSNSDISARKVKRTVNKTVNESNLNGLYDRVFSTENIQIGSLVVCSVAAAAAFGSWALKVGAMNASQIVATNLIAFLQPGMTVVGYALKVGMFITLNAVVPLASALVTISLPIVSTIVVTTISVLVILHIFNKMIQKLEESVKSGVDAAKELPGKLLEQIPGYSTISSLLGYGKDSPSKEPKVALRQKRQVAQKDSAPFLDDFKAEVKPRPSKRESAIYTRQDFIRNKIATGE
jgi:hypothetical protein